MEILDTKINLWKWITIAFLIIAVISVASWAGGYLGLFGKTISAQNFEKNYEWFKGQEMSISQINNQVCYQIEQANDFKKLYGEAENWTKTTKQSYDDLMFVKNGYVSKYNSLVAEYNARRSSFIKNFGRDINTPDEKAEFYEADCK